MRDIELLPASDNAYLRPQAAGLPNLPVATDPSFSDTMAYAKPSLGGEFGPARALLLSGPSDGGLGALDAPALLTVMPLAGPLPPVVWPGRAANNTSFLNLYPWHKVPKEGLDQNNPNPPPAADPPPPPPAHGITIPVLQLVGNSGTVQFSGPALTSATVIVYYAVDGGPMIPVSVSISAGDTASQIAAKVRNAVDPIVGVDASGTGGTVNVIGIGGVLTGFNVTIS